MIGGETCQCKSCGAETDKLGTQLCDVCREILRSEERVISAKSKTLTCERCGWEIDKGVGKCTNIRCVNSCLKDNYTIESVPRCACDMCRELDEHTVDIKVQMPDHKFSEVKGMKKDEGKQKWHALPLVILEPLADVMEAGAKKYAKFNCLQPFDDPDERFYDGMMRHVEICQLDPLAIDEETGCYHAAQIAFNTLMRLYHCKNKK